MAKASLKQKHFHDTLMTLFSVACSPTFDAITPVRLPCHKGANLLFREASIRIAWFGTEAYTNLVRPLPRGANSYLYTITQYGDMLQDEVRVSSHYEALKQVIRPGDVVVDIGSGTGIFSLMACQLGASRVYAIEANPLGWLSTQMASANGFADRIEVIQGLSTEVTLPELGDVLIGDLRGVSPVTPENILSFIDARQRFLKPSGTIIPHRDVVYVSLVTAPNLYESKLGRPWLDNSYGLNMEAGFRFAANSIHRMNAPNIAPPLFPPQTWADIDYYTLENPNLSVTLEWTATEAVTAHAIISWFRAHLADGISYSNAPWEQNARAYGTFWLFLQKPLDIAPTDRLQIELKALLVKNDYVYVWNTTLQSSSGEVKSQFQQSSFFSKPPTSYRWETPNSGK